MSNFVTSLFGDSGLLLRHLDPNTIDNFSTKVQQGLDVHRQVQQAYGSSQTGQVLKTIENVADQTNHSGLSDVVGKIKGLVQTQQFIAGLSTVFTGAEAGVEILGLSIAPELAPFVLLAQAPSVFKFVGHEAKAVFNFFKKRFTSPTTYYGPVPTLEPNERPEAVMKLPTIIEANLPRPETLPSENLYLQPIHPIIRSKLYDHVLGESINDHRLHMRHYNYVEHTPQQIGSKLNEWQPVIYDHHHQVDVQPVIHQGFNDYNYGFKRDAHDVPQAQNPFPMGFTPSNIEMSYSPHLVTDRDPNYRPRQAEVAQYVRNNYI